MGRWGGDIIINIGDHFLIKYNVPSSQLNYHYYARAGKSLFHKYEPASA